MFDVDIDFYNRDQILSLIKHRKAGINSHGKLVAHNSGVYLHEIPHNPITNISTIEYSKAGKRGYFKLDFLNVGVYRGVKSEEHLITLMETEPIWELLEKDEFNRLLFHVKGHGDILRAMKPRNIEQLAAVLAVIRPAKRYLMNMSWDTILAEVWKKTNDDSYTFKRSHSFGYAAAVIVQMNLICERMAKKK